MAIQICTLNPNLGVDFIRICLEVGETMGIDQKSGNQKYSLLTLVQYLETGASKGYQIWHEYL